MQREMAGIRGADDLKRIQGFPIFESLSLKELRQMLSRGERQVYAKGEYVCLENEPGDDFFLSLDGKVKVCLISEEGKEVIVSYRNPGEFFGEMAIIDGKPRSATVIALTDTVIYSFRKDEFLTLIRRHPAIAFKLMQSLSSQLREADARIRTLALLDVYGRVARTFVDLAKREGQRQPDGTIMFQRPTQENIAKMVGASRETVSRTMKEMQKQGFFQERGKHIYLPASTLETE